MRSWRELRPEVVTDEAQVSAQRANLEAEIRAYRPAEIRAAYPDLAQPQGGAAGKGEHDGALAAPPPQGLRTLSPTSGSWSRPGLA